MAYQPVKCRSFKYTRTSIADAAWTKLLPNRDRDHLVIAWDGTNDFQLYYKGESDAAPSAATDGTKIHEHYRGDFLTRDFIPVGEVWVYQATGGPVFIEAREGFVDAVAPA